MTQARDKPASPSKSAASVVHSFAEPVDGARLSAPAAMRNAGPIVEALTPYAPATGTGLEIAAGTGQHAVAIARAFPDLDWQPTDIDPARLASIDAWAASEGLGNIRPAQPLDVSTPDWRHGPADLIFCANLTHLVAAPVVQSLISGVARSLAPGGLFALYGPFRTGGAFRSLGDETFHDRLTAQDPAAGYKDFEWIDAEARGQGLSFTARLDMPANNLIGIWTRPT